MSKIEVKPDIRRIEVSTVAHEILAYLFENPKSQDTIEGILEWWLLDQKIMYRKKEVEEAISELIAKGLITKHKGRNSLIHYQINHRKYREIQALLNNTHI